MSETPHHAFHQTRWTLVARAVKEDDPAAPAALDELCRLYWPPLCAFARRQGLSDADAEDVTQNFFAELLRNGKLALADADRGKLRTFLLHTFSKRLINHQARTRVHLPLDAVRENRDPRSPEAEFNRQWAITTMETTLARLAAEYAESGKSEVFEALRPFLSLDSAGDAARIAAQLGMKEGALRVIIHRLRHRFREILFATIAETLDTPTESAVRAEIGLLMDSLG